MAKTFLMLLAGMLCLTTNYAQNCRVHSRFWDDYTGMINKKLVQLSVFAGEDGTLVGNYRFVENEKDVFKIKGKQNDCHFTLTITDSGGKQAGSFDFTRTPDFLKGEYRDANNKKEDI